MITEQTCPQCGQSNWKPFLQTRNLRTSRELFAIVECTCGMLATLPRPDDEALGAYYDPANYDSHKAKGKGLKDAMYEAVRKRALRTKLGWVQGVAPSNRWLDYGCGTGDVLGYAHTKGWAVTGVEASPDARKTAYERNKLHVLAPTEVDQILPKSQGAISLFHVLEHLPDPVGHLKQFWSWLEDKGALIIAVPNPESPDAQYYGAHWAAWDVPLHLWHFRPANLIQMVEKQGFKLVKTHPMWFDAPYVAGLSEAHRGAKGAFIKGLFRGLLSNVHARGGKNASSLVYFFQKAE